MIEFGYMKKCVTCLKDGSYPLCKTCLRDPLKVEKARQIISETGKLKLLRKMYSKTFPELKDINSIYFWDDKLSQIQTLHDQDDMTKDRIRKVISYIPNRARKILDVGAGYGFLEEKLTNDKIIKFDYYAVDISAKSIENLKKRFPGVYHVSSIYKLPFKKDFFDVVVALEILEHIPASSVFKAYRELRRIISLNGLLILSVPLNEGLVYKTDNPSGHLREYTASLIKSELRLAGFDIVDYKELYAFKNCYEIKNILRRTMLKKRWKPNNIVISSIKI